MKKTTIATVAMLSILIISTGCFPQKETVADQVRSLEENLDPNGLNCRNLTLSGDGAPVDVQKLDDGYCYPTGIFTTPTDPDQCESTHYHYTLLSLDGSQTRNDEGHPCGAAKQTEFLGKGTVHVGNDVIETWNAKWKEISTPDKSPKDFKLKK